MEFYDDMYIPYAEIKFENAKLQFDKIILFRNVYLNMQGMNIYLTDPVITKWEYDLLDEYMEIERTPTENALMVSAFSQMWIFQVYELLRTLRQKKNRIGKKSHDGSIIGDSKTLAEHIENSLIEKCRIDAEELGKLEKQWNCIEPVYKEVESMRMNLAKHEIPRKEVSFSPAPGYGRINMVCGSLDYQLVDKNGSMYFRNRRNIADMIRRIDIFA
jgi:hypothetical protein